jgi:hypothetical protein
MHNVGNNSGVIVGGNVNDSPITIGSTGHVSAGTDEAEVLRRLDKLVTELLTSLGQLSAEQAGEAASSAVLLKQEVSLSDRNPERIRGVARNLMQAVGTVVPLIELVRDITDIATSLH